MDKQEFLKKYDIKESDFEKTTLNWDDLILIYNDYLREINELKKLANFTEECLIDTEKVHSIKKRIKDPEHLIEKIIRKKIAKPEREIHVNNYKEVITDLIGVRVLHLFKEDWITIHDYIMRKWNTKDVPMANVREGDKGEFINKFKEMGCEVRVHPYGYRSVHYLILLPHNKKEITAEIQVRTVFEEAWSEIDHRIRYPYDIDNPILSEYLVIFNRLAGSADEMGSFIKLLKEDLNYKSRELEEKNRIINELQREINSSKLEKEEKERITSGLQRLFMVESGSSINHIFDEDTLDEASKELENILGNITLAEAAKEMQNVLDHLSVNEVSEVMKMVLNNRGFSEAFKNADMFSGEEKEPEETKLLEWEKDVPEPDGKKEK
ncbi:MAG: hypothetical protein N2645_16140 [Clostridia bacterium]|nr:hypothetical protein [Clostridia bacterium]